MSDSKKLEDIENRRKKLVFRSWHRGTREMDLIMGSFANTHIEAMSAEELDLYDELLHNPDPDLYDWISGRTGVPEEHQSPVMSKLLEHHYAANSKTGSDDR
jgi:antitoxin CptB